MKLFTAILSLALLSVIVGCGDEGIGFNIGKEVPATIPVDLPFSNPGNLPVGFNPDAYTEETEFNLTDIASEDDLDNLDGIVINAISYDLTGITSGEDVQVDNFSLSFRTEGGILLATIPIATNAPLANISKSEADFNQAGLQSALENNETIISEFTIDFQTVPNNDIDFDFTFYFDVVVKIRE